MGRATAALTALLLFPAATTGAAELEARTAAAFDRYVAETERRIRTEVEGPAAFLWVDRQTAEVRTDVYRRLRDGEVVVESLQTRRDGAEIKIPGGLAHHWVGTVLIPDVSLEETLRLIRDYDRYPEVYAPNVRAARVLAETEAGLTVHTRLYMKKVITVVLDTENAVEFVPVTPRRSFVPSRSRRIVELVSPDTPEERARPEGDDRGFLWRFNNYCSFEERTEGTYMQCESVSLSRGIPRLLGFIVRPFVTSVPRESMAFTLNAARDRLTGTGS